MENDSLLFESSLPSFTLRDKFKTVTVESVPIILLRIKFKITTYHTQMDSQPEKLSNIDLKKINRDYCNSK